MVQKPEPYRALGFMLADSLEEAWKYLGHKQNGTAEEGGGGRRGGRRFRWSRRGARTGLGLLFELPLHGCKGGRVQQVGIAGRFRAVLQGELSRKF